MSGPRNTDLRELQRIYAEMRRGAAKNAAAIAGISIPAERPGWLRRGAEDSGYEDLEISPLSMTLDSVSPPTAVAWKTSLLKLQFGAAGGEYAYFDGKQIPHAHAVGSDLYPHVRFVPTTAISDGETVIWTITYTIANTWAVSPAAGTVTATFTNDSTTRAHLPAAALSGTDVVADSHLVATGATISGYGIEMSAVLDARIERSAADTFAGNVLLGSVGIHALLDRSGSQQEYSG